MNDYQSWGQYPKATSGSVYPVRWRDEPIEFDKWEQSLLPYGCGRSYGDSCLNDGGVLLTTKGLNRFMAFDEQQGILQCEAGTSLAEILRIFIPKGWFVPVTPGTQHVSVGGAIANDVHGKNHHRAGTFGCHILSFELLRSDGERVTCTPNHHADFFHATIGGLGLTGLITHATLQLKPITTDKICSERIRFSQLKDFFDLSQESDETFEYTVAWIDCLSGPREIGRGFFIRGNHLQGEHGLSTSISSRPRITIPFNAPSILLNQWTLKIFNTLYFHHQGKHPVQTTDSYECFFYPLDRIHHWNRLYGARGFLQYQCVIPTPEEREGILELLKVIHKAKQGSFLAVLKKFGDVPSPGLLSFPRSGTTLALDFPFLGEKTLTLFTKLDHIVRETGGAVYPAKDARMSAQDFQAYFPRWEEFLTYKDPKFSSGFWRRVTNDDQFTSEKLKDTLLKSSRSSRNMAVNGRE